MENVSIQHKARVPFGVMLLIKKGAMLSLIFINKFVFIVLCLSFLIYVSGRVKSVSEPEE